MKEEPTIIMAALEDIYLMPAEISDATTTPIRDEETRLLRDETGLLICEG